MKRYVTLFVLACTLIVMLTLFQTSQVDEERPDVGGYTPTVQEARRRSIPPPLPATIHCDKLIARLNTTVPILLIDLDILQNIQNDNCNATIGKPVKASFTSIVRSRKKQVGVDVKYLAEHGLLENPALEVVYFSNDSKKDYLDFRTEPRNIIPKKFETRWVEHVKVPSDISTFLEFWKRAKFLQCMNLFIPRKAGNKPHMQPRPATAQLALLRDELIASGMYPFLNGGTLLGWFRECSVIPHTTDMDVAIVSENYNSGFLDNIANGNSSFRLSRKFGMLNDSFELTVAPNSGYLVYIDIFTMYKGIENGTEFSWVGGVAGDGTKYLYKYPPYSSWCAADLHGHIFWVTCTPRQQIVLEYGELWYQDHPTATYSWYSSQKNVRENGKWTKEQMKEIYHVYG
uniref:W02B3.4-like N-terminal domain-containing protein n=1 Tax=Caenorhabditis japonica TaxID=281687 RepID=A0A8R1HJ91_CAEJA